MEVGCFKCPRTEVALFVASSIFEPFRVPCPRLYTRRLQVERRGVTRRRVVPQGHTREEGAERKEAKERKEGKEGKEI